MQVPSGHARFFIALLPTPAIQAEVTAIKHIFVDNYNSKGALKSPPHITLQAPFIWAEDRLSDLDKSLTDFAKFCSPLQVKLSGFAAFIPRVIYINVLDNPDLEILQKKLAIQCSNQLGIQDNIAQDRPFIPHMTVAFRDLTKANFDRAWSEFERRDFSAEWLATELTLLIHNGQRWEVRSHFSFGYLSAR
jgi:2'-5' RNA ligase